MEGVELPSRSSKGSSLRRMQSEYHPGSMRGGGHRSSHPMTSSRRESSRGGFWDTVMDRKDGGSAQLGSGSSFHMSGNSSPPSHIHPAQSFHVGSSASSRVSSRHSAPKRFACTQCNSTYGSPKELQMHMIQMHTKKTHESDRPYTCEVCKNKFSQKSHLNQHRRTVHEKVRPHVCDLCPKAFGKKYDLASHRDAVHANERRHQCDFCDKKFAKRSNLTRHKEKLHKNGTYSRK